MAASLIIVYWVPQVLGDHPSWTWHHIGAVADNAVMDDVSSKGHLSTAVTVSCKHLFRLEPPFTYMV